MKRKGFATKHKVEERQVETVQEQIAATLLLTGGQQYTVTISPDDPLLQEVYETLVATDAAQVRRLFQVPINNGQAVLAFPSDRLVGLITEPPLIIEHHPTASSAAASTIQSSSSEQDLRSEYLQLDQFLSSADHQRLLDYVQQRAADFEATATFTGAANYRESVVLYSFPEFADLITQQIQEVIPDVLNKLNLPPFTVSQVEAQLTAHNHGQFYKIHNDNGSPDTATRVLTFVYYFYRDPKPFSGGELVIYDSQVQNNYYVQADTFRTVEPRNNSIVFFLSRYMHEVLPIHCPSQQFADSRFTINGWIRH